MLSVSAPLKMRHVSFLLWILSVVILSFGTELKTLYEWKFVDFVWKTLEDRQLAIDSGRYNASACVLYDVDEAPDGRTFVTAVRDKGVPASLMTVTDKMGEGGPLLRPYPDWSWYETYKCNNKTIISVYRVYVKCNHIFVLDCGKIGDDKICPARLFIFDLMTDKLIRQVTIPDNVAANRNGTGLLVTPLVYARSCGNIAHIATVYMADIEGYGLVVWNAKNSQFCRFESDYMKPTNPTFTIDNQSFNLPDGILGLTFVNKDLYYANLAGDNIYKINTWALQRCGLNTQTIDKFTQLAGILEGQTAPIASKDCAIFFSNIPQTSIMCADTSEEINPNTTEIIAYDAKKLQFPSGMKTKTTVKRHRGNTREKFIISEWDKSDKNSHLMILTNRFQRFATNTYDLNETNFRILDIDLEEVREYTSCFASCDYEEFEYISWNRDVIYNIW